jgi:PAS domain S-box-containing protein
LILVRDVTDQVRAQNELRESESRYRGLIERLADGVLIVRGGRIAYANRAAELLLEAPGRQLAGTPLRDRVATRDVLVLEERLGAVERGATADDEIACTLVAGGGGLLDVRMRASAVPLGEGSGVLLLLRDETGQRRAEREIRRNEARLDAVLEAASDGFVLVGDRGGRPVVHVANRAFATMFDVPPGELLGMGFEELASRLARTGAAGARAVELLRGGAAAASPVTVATDEPSASIVLLRATALRDDLGNTIGQLLVCRDLTEQRRSERRLEEQAERIEAGRVELEETYGGLHEAHAELERRNDELDRLNGELRRLDKMKSDLLVVSVRGYTEMILRERLGPINEEQRKGLTRSLSSVDRMIAMIEGLLEVARSEPARGGHGSHTRFPLRRLVEEAWVGAPARAGCGEAPRDLDRPRSARARALGRARRAPPGPVEPPVERDQAQPRRPAHRGALGRTGAGPDRAARAGRGTGDPDRGARAGLRAPLPDPAAR